ncbi:aminopeptidase PepB [Actinobacillus minor]|uniref:aminopeptidase PepB n=1 Tax=Actinobacillus minor TaxID=51047 RepID=UPI0023F5665E|nr:aminopeptidase PepB [Actinobacillus minor]MDD6910319.1 aminopeptidase PepB [Actinobacillus minor]MDY4714026.1 aminopeptidase PepB [Actinobacillus minor]
MQIKLSTQPAPSAWGKKAILSATESGMTIHLQEPSLQTIQKAARKIKNQGILDVSLIGDGWDLEHCWAFHQGFNSVKQAGSVQYPDLGQEQAEFEARVECSIFTRTLINLPSDQLTPLELVKKAQDFLTEQAVKKGLKNAISVEVIAGEALKEKGFHGIWMVGKGSENPPAFLHLDFNPTGKDDEPVLACLVGKGITFDTGGYSLKPSDSMSTMRTDMGGAALLTGSLGFAIARGLKKRVKLFLCCAENMVSHNAFKLGDIITYRNGVTAEVLNTDAEGRLVLADGLIEADKQNAQFILDVATLTGAAKVAVGNDYHSVLSMDEQLVDALFQSAKAENEPFWRLPFEAFHRSQISSSFADIANIGSVPVGAGASTACAFLSYFVENYQQNWLHIDASATFRKSASDLWAAGATGIGMRTIANLLLSK